MKHLTGWIIFDLLLAAALVATAVGFENGTEGKSWVPLIPATMFLARALYGFFNPENPTKPNDKNDDDHYSNGMKIGSK